MKDSLRANPCVEIMKEEDNNTRIIRERHPKVSRVGDR